MATFVLTNATIWHGGVDLTAASRGVALDYRVEARDSTTFGNTTRTHKAGLYVVQASVEGFQDETLTGATIFDAVGTGTQVFTVTPTGTDGEPGFSFRGLTADHTPQSGQVGEMSASTLQMQGRSGDPLVKGTLLHATGTARTATGNGTGRQLGAAASGESVYGALHVTAASGTSPTLDVVVQSDDNSGFTTPTTRLTFSQATGATAQWQSAAGPITDDWWRITYTIGGTSPSFTFAVNVGIR